MRRPVGRVVAGSVLVIGAVVAGLPAGPTRSASAAVTSSWTVYHGNPEGTGVAVTGVTFRHAGPAPTWTSPALDGEVYGEPLEATGRVFVATENDTVYALAAASGGVLWSTHVGMPVPSSDLPCGNITPTVGITGTPVIDMARGEIFVVADELAGGTVQHHLVGLDLYTGAIELDQAVDPSGATTSSLLQRTGLNLDADHVVFGFGGNYGDCGTYHGWVESVPEGGGAASFFEVDQPAGDTQGAVWMGGAAPEVDASGNVWVAAGNGSVKTGTKTYDTSDSVLELGSSLNLLQNFHPSTWRTDNRTDLDLGSTAPALLPNGTVFQIGKSQTGYLLTAGHLGGTDGQLAESAMCLGDADGGDAVVGTVVYVGCVGGVVAVQTAKTPPSLTFAWTAKNGAKGPPIVAGGLVWAMGNTALSGITPATGTPVARLDVGSEANDFPTPSVGDGLLLASGTAAGDAQRGDRVMAFAGSAGLPGTPSYPTNAPASLTSYWEVASDGGIFAYGQAAFHGSMGGKPLNEPIVGMAADRATGGYWEVASDGGVFSFTAPFHGSMGGKPLNEPIVGMAADPATGGYWEVASDGGVFSFTAPFLGSEGGKPLNEPIVGMAADPATGGYWEVASDGGVFSFTAPFLGSEGGKPLNEPIVGMAATPTGNGYWLVASDGGVFAFGAAGFDGSMGGKPLNEPIVGMAATPTGDGYWLVASDGGIFTFGAAVFQGSKGGQPLDAPVVGIAAG